MSGHICEHEHDERDRESEAAGDDLFPVIDTLHIRTLNADAEGTIIRPHSKRWEAGSLRCEDDMIMIIPFIANVTLTSITLRTLNGTEVELYTKEPTFDDDRPSDRVRCIASRDMIEYKLRPSRFTNLTLLGLCFRGEWEITYLRLKGTYQPLSKAPEGIVYEAYPTPSKGRVEGVKMAF